MSKPFTDQVSGDHYMKLPLQLTEFCQKNELRWCEANVIKYVVRHRDKGGIADIHKAMHYLELLLELEYGNDNRGAT